MNLENLKDFDLFLNAVDYINFVPNSNIDEFMFLLEKNNIQAIKKYSYSNQFVFIVKDYDNYFRFFNLIISSNLGHFSRLDLKFDFLCEYKLFLKEFNIVSSDRKVIAQGLDIQTVYIGSRNSDCYCRIYDKRVESNLNFNLTRVEFEFKNDIIKEASVRLLFFGFEDFSNFIINKINDFCISNNLNFFEKIKKFNLVPFKFFNKQENFQKLNYFITHNSNTFNELCKLFNFDSLTFSILLENHITDNELYNFINFN